MNEIRIKRVYQAIEEFDGYRILTDRLWPRGIAKDKADIDLWAKFIAPTVSLRQWFGHKPENFPLFTERYTEELEKNPESKKFIEVCETQLKKGNVTLLYGAKDETHNHAVVLRAFINRHLSTE